jgi:hypothetical protein
MKDTSRTVSSWPRGRLAIAAAGAAIALGLQLAAVREQSLTGDGAYHLVAGHQAVRYGQNLLNLEHPPLVKLIAAAPSLLENRPLVPPARVEQWRQAINHAHRQPEVLQRAVHRGRLLVLCCFALPLLAACFALGTQFGGAACGLVLALLTALSFSVVPQLSLLQTDTAVAAAFVAAVVLCARYLRLPTLGNAALMGLACGVAISVKFSGLLLVPTVAISVLISARQFRTRIAHLVVVAALALGLIEISYAAANCRYDSAAGRQTIRSYCRAAGTLKVTDRMRPLEGPLLAVEEADPRLAQWLLGALGIMIQDQIGVYPSYAFGTVTSQGRWWYYPVLILVKTPAAILVAAAVLAILWWRRRPPPGQRRLEIPRLAVPLLLTVAVYLAAAMTSNYNLSVRHLLPVLPMLYLPVAVGVARSRAASIALVTVLAVESLLLAPLWMSATNTWWLGDRNPIRFSLGGGDLEYGQNFIKLAKETRRRNIDSLRVLYPVLEPAVLAAYLPGARLVGPGDPIDPGWYAVNVTVEQLVPAVLAARPESLYNHRGLTELADRWRPFWDAVAAGDDHGYVAATFHLYYHPGAVPAAHSVGAPLEPGQLSPNDTGR